MAGDTPKTKAEWSDLIDTYIVALPLMSNMPDDEPLPDSWGPGKCNKLLKQILIAQEEMVGIKRQLVGLREVLLEMPDDHPEAPEVHEKSMHMLANLDEDMGLVSELFNETMPWYMNCIITELC